MRQVTAAARVRGQAAFAKAGSSPPMSVVVSDLL
jgi:hypothetical protein